MSKLEEYKALADMSNLSIPAELWPDYLVRSKLAILDLIVRLEAADQAMQIFTIYKGEFTGIERALAKETLERIRE